MATKKGVEKPIISKVTGLPVDPKRSRAAKKAAKTRKANLALQSEIRQSARLHHKIVTGGAILAVLVFTFFGIRGQLEAYAATTATGTFIGLGGKCLDNSGARLQQNNKVQLYKCNGTKAQKWVLTPSGSLKANNGSNYCLDVPGNSKAEYTYLRLWKCNETGAQHFTVKNNSLIGNTTKFCATVHYAETANGTKIWMKACHSSNAQKWTYSGTGNSGSIITPPTTPTPPTPPTSGGGTTTPTPPSGPTTTANFNLTSTLNALTTNTNLSLKSGTYSFSDFSQYNTMGAYSKKVTGIAGAGVDKSIIQMNPGTSSKARNVPTASGTTNQLNLLRVDGTQRLSDFTLQGTNQGHLYNGLSLYYNTGTVLTNVKIAAIPGDNHYPPGETFSINDFHGNNNVYNNVEVDGAGVGASAFGLNSSSGGTWNNSYAHDNKYSIGWAFWQHTNGATINNSRSINNYGGVNFERATGTYNLNNMTFGGNKASDVSGGQDQNGDFKVIVRDPKFINGQTKLKVNWFKTEAGVPNKYGKKNIQVIVNGVDRTNDMIQWVGVGAG